MSYQYNGSPQERYYWRNRSRVLKRQKARRELTRSGDLARLRRWRKNNPDACLKQSLWRTGHLLTVPEFRKLERDQQGRCKLCRRAPARGYRLSVDHCHKKNKFRGLLCVRCNSGLGYFQESPELMLRAIEYLQNEGKLS